MKFLHLKLLDLLRQST